MYLKKILFIVSLSLGIFTSCKNSFDVQAPYKDETIVYGLLDQNDPIHYIRIDKAFEGNGNAYTMAQQYDSLYYPANIIRAVLEDSNPTTNAIAKIDSLDTTTAVPLNPGVFSYPKQLLYYTKAELNPNDYYNLIILNTKTGKRIIGSTALLPDVQLQGWHAKVFNISFYNQAPTVVQWYTTLNARLYQMTIRFYYDEATNNGRSVKYLDWVFAPLISPILTGGAQLNYSFTAQGLCSLILNSIPYEEGVTRYVDSVGIMFTSGTDDLNTYIQLSQPPTGINQDIPLYSDLKNGVGLFTARHIQTSYKELNDAFIDTLVAGPAYSKLNFQL
jgi:hypothetical protein